MRLERDLEPGNLTVPEISLMGCSTISGKVDGFPAAVTEAKILKGARLEVKFESLFKAQQYFDELFITLDPKIKEPGAE